MDMAIRIQQLDMQLNEHIARRDNLRLGLRQANILIERLQGALALAREMMEADHATAVVHDSGTVVASGNSDGGDH
jgi:hypothetical protein